MSMVKKKSKLTKEIREAGISDKDQEFMSSFTDMMTNDNNVQSLDSITSDDKKLSYVPSEKELHDTLNKAKEMDKSIMKEVHPEEFKKQEDLKE